MRAGQYAPRCSEAHLYGEEQSLFSAQSTTWDSGRDMSVPTASEFRHIINGNRLNQSNGMHKGISRVFSSSPLASVIDSSTRAEAGRVEGSSRGSCYRPLNERCHISKIDGTTEWTHIAMIAPWWWWCGLWRCSLIEHPPSSSAILLIKVLRDSGVVALIL